MIAGLAILSLCALSAINSASRAESFVILSYQGFDDDAGTSISTNLFTQHIAELKTGPYNVASLDTVLELIRSGAPLPERTIVITLSEALSSAYEHAWPLLKEAGLPFTLFVTAGQIGDKAGPYYMNWTQIRELADGGATLGNGSLHHDHMLTRPVRDLRTTIDEASGIFTQKLGFAPKYFSYPYGEFSAEIAGMVKDMGFDAGLAEYSSVADRNGNLYALPRFIMSERYGDMNRFRLVANAMALPATDIVPTDPLITTNPPAFGFTLTEDIAGLSALACYPSHLSAPADITRVGPRRLEVRFDKPFPKGAARINCTMPGQSGRWYWFGQPFFIR